VPKAYRAHLILSQLKPLFALFQSKIVCIVLFIGVFLDCIPREVVEVFMNFFWLCKHVETSRTKYHSGEEGKR
jgi:hypothetical protein